VQAEAATEGGHFFRSRRHTDLRRSHLEFDCRAVSDIGADLDFGDAARVGKHEFDLAESWDA
jgi:hypothetical protein